MFLDDAINKTASAKKQPVDVSPEIVKTSSVDDIIDGDHGDEGQWLTQSNKQINSRNRNKVKNETLNSTNQESVTLPAQIQSVSSSNRKTTSEKRTAVGNDVSSSITNKNESDAEPTVASNTVVQSAPQEQEPIEICQLLPMHENRYTANDDWWKQALNKQQTFTVDDIGEWPEREYDEQYVVQVKRIIPTKNISTINKTALAAKDVNIDESDSNNMRISGKEDKVKT